MFSEYPAILDLIHTVSIVQEIGILLFELFLKSEIDTQRPDNRLCTAHPVNGG